MTIRRTHRTSTGARFMFWGWVTAPLGLLLVSVVGRFAPVEVALTVGAGVTLGLAAVLTFRK